MKRSTLRILKSGAIGDNDSILYEDFAVTHLSPAAKWRLIELHNRFDNMDYDEAEKILISEGLYEPPNEDIDVVPRTVVTETF